MISANMPYKKSFKTINGKSIAFVDVGEGDPIVLLHGNPTSSYLWRNVIPHLEGMGRVIAPDLIGQGDSDKLPASDGPDRYSFQVAYDYLAGLLDELDANQNVTLVIHDWGSALGFYWAQQHGAAVKGIAYMEGIVCPVGWEDWPESARGIFKGFRSDKGEDLILQRNMFVEAVLPSSVIRKLDAEEMEHYRRAFSTPDDHLEGMGRVIAPDLIGQGDSDKLPASDGPDRYSFQVAYDYLAGLLDELDANQNVTLVIHDWGSALGFYWAQQHGAAVKGIAYMEGIVCPVGWEDWPESARGIFKGFRSDKGEDLILQRNMFVEAVLPSSVIRKLDAEEMEHYRRAFSTPDDRQPTLNWPRQIPIDGEPEHMVKLVDSYGQWMLENTSLPKLFINATPGSILTGKAREFCRTWPNQREVTVAGTHFIQEDSPDEIGSAVAEWLNSL